MNQEDLSIKDNLVEENTKIKELIVQYAGNKLQPEDGNVTIDMVLGVMADEFPEFLLVLAEENYIRGYEQALNDIQELKKKYGDQVEVHPKQTQASS
tara:strand:+ start:59 stop:349 length:291 start_codon:yes stop_codon:yes gene_type:complete